ncbi:MAG: hypothetical protein Q8S32_16160 [Burkholderiaceae bacterium]|nr:hypothetical protein [Burkholderiaceae bacterium]
MTNTSPFTRPSLPGLSLLQNLLESAQPPDWVIDETQNRLVLLLNHVLMQEPQAMDRLRRQQGKSARLVWGRFELTLQASPAGLLARQPYPVPAGETAVVPDLTITLTQTAVPSLVAAALRGEKPAVRIEGDVQLAAEVAWLSDNVRWDIEEDLSRVLGDAPAHTLLKALGGVRAAMQSFVSRMPQPFGRQDNAPATP